jgi:hypothetical protein
MKVPMKRNTYHNSFNRKVKLFLDKKFRNIEMSSDIMCEKRIDNIFRTFTQPTTCYQDIRYTTKLDPVATEVLIKNCEEISYNFYNDNMAAKEWKISDLRNCFNEAQYSMKGYVSDALKKESWTNEKEQIKKDKSTQVKKLEHLIEEKTRVIEVKITEIWDKLREKETINRIFRLETSKSSSLMHQNYTNHSKNLIREIPTEDHVITKDILFYEFYDVPRYWKDEDIIGAPQNLGYIKRLRVKRSYKYISVRVDINLNKLAQEKYDKGAANVAIVHRNRKFFFRWFPESFKTNINF